MESLYNDSLANDSLANNTNTNTTNYGSYWIFIVMAGPIAVIIFIAVCVYIYSKTIKKCYKENKGKIVIKSVLNPVFIGKINTKLPEDTICCICLDEVTNKQDYVSLNCGHIFHNKCLETWVKTQNKNKYNSNCPLCRMHNKN